ncbi:MAG: hypothetical protein HGA22_02770 [Clostridiales bacterium]|nr:hypothetical protein [Clostridiales bacterium]
MVEVYYYIPANRLEDALDCGIKLSAYFNRETMIEGEMKKCLTALLNPRDDIAKYNDPDYRCLKLEILPKYCHAADDFAYRLGGVYPEAMESFLKSIVPIGNYTFGRYRMPVCLITTTVIAEDIKLLDKRLDSPVLYNNSEELYLDNLMETGYENCPDFKDALLYCYYSRMADMGRLEMLEDYESRLALFTDKDSGKVYTLRIPDLKSYTGWRNDNE